MKKKKITIFTCLLILFINLKAQTVSSDNSFATDGYYTLSQETNGWSLINSIIQNDNKIIFVGQRLNPTTETFVGRLNSDGSLDTSFANNGFFTDLPVNEAFITDLYFIDNHIFIYYSSIYTLVKLDINGVPDSSFGINGTKQYTIPNINYDNGTIFLNNNLYWVTTQNENQVILNKINLANGEIIYSKVLDGITDSYGLYNGPGNTFLVRSVDTNLYKVFLSLYDIDGNLISAFGNNGSVEVASFNNVNDFEASYDYSQIEGNNIIYGTTNENNFTTTLKKIDLTGQTSLSFGNAGIVTLNNTIFSDLKYFNQKIYFSGAEINNGAIDLKMGRLNSNGTLDTTFNNSGLFIENSNGTQEWAESLNILNDDSYILAGEIKNGTNNKIFVAKYVLKNNLSTNESKDKIVSFENPVLNKLSYKSLESIKSIQLYSPDGKLIKEIRNNNADVSELAKGIYFLKIYFATGKSTSLKILKK